MMKLPINPSGLDEFGKWATPNKQLGWCDSSCWMKAESYMLEGHQMFPLKPSYWTLFEDKSQYSVHWHLKFVCFTSLDLSSKLIILTFTESNRSFGKKRLKPTSFLEREIQSYVYYALIRLRNANWQALLTLSDLSRLVFPVQRNYQQKLQTDTFRQTSNWRK